MAEISCYRECHLIELTDVLLQGYCKHKAYIGTQAPLPDTFEDFWRLVWEQDSASIVMLTKEEEGGKVRISCSGICFLSFNISFEDLGLDMILI